MLELKSRKSFSPTQLHRVRATASKRIDRKRVSCIRVLPFRLLVAIPQGYCHLRDFEASETERLTIDQKAAP